MAHVPAAPRGRVGIFELLTVGDEIRQALVERRPAGELRRIAIAGGMRSLMQDARRQVALGRTTAEEAARACRDD